MSLRLMLLTQTAAANDNSTSEGRSTPRSVTTKLLPSTTTSPLNGSGRSDASLIARYFFVLFAAMSSPAVVACKHRFFLRGFQAPFLLP